MTNIIEDILKKNGAGREKLEQKTVEIERVIDEAAKDYGSKLDEMFSGGTAAAQKTNVGKELSIMDTAIAKGMEYQHDLNDLIDELTRELEGLGRRVSETTNYSGFEKVLRFLGGTGKANRMRIERIKSNNVEQSMNIVVQYARGIVESLDRQIVKNTEVYNALGDREQTIVVKLKENQPKYEEWREKAKAFEIEIKDCERKLRESNETERPAVESRITELTAERNQAKLNETSYFEIVKIASESIDLVRLHRKGFMNAIDALTQSKIKTAEKIDNLTEVFKGIYQIMETALEIKGFSRIDATINRQADKTTEILNIQIEAILAETAARNEMKIIDDGKLSQYLDHFEETVKKFNEGMNRQKEKYAGKAA